MGRCVSPPSPGQPMSSADGIAGAAAGLIMEGSGTPFRVLAAPASVDSRLTKRMRPPRSATVALMWFGTNVLTVLYTGVLSTQPTSRKYRESGPRGSTRLRAGASCLGEAAVQKASTGRRKL